MNLKNPFLAAFGVGIVLIAIAVAGVFYMQRGARVGLTGKFLKVRLAPLDETSTAVVVDFRFTNPSDVNFVVRNVTVIMEDNAGNQYDGQTVSEVDAKRLFDAVPLLGEKYNPTLVIMDKIAPKVTEDRMVAARFAAPESKIEPRKRFLVRIEEVDGSIVEFSEK